MSEPAPDRPAAARRPRTGVIAVRYVIPAALVVAGQGILVIGPQGAHLEGWAMFTGAGLSVLLLNVLHRAGVSGDSERDREEQARAFFDAHGRWPDEPPLPGERILVEPERQPPPGRLTPKVSAREDPRRRREADQRPAARRSASVPPRRRGPSH